MNDYREDMQNVHKKARWTFWKFLPLTIIVILFLSVLGFGLHSLELWGSTVVERKVFEASYQRTESIKAQIATDEAVLAEVEMQLRNPELDESTRYSLEAQATAAKVRIAIAKGKK